MPKVYNKCKDQGNQKPQWYSNCDKRCKKKLKKGEHFPFLDK